MGEEICIDQFTGTEHLYRHFTGITYTDGIKYLADNTDSHWLIDLIASYQHEKKYREQPFQVWILTVNKKDNTAVARAEDGNGNIIGKQEIQFTDFPLYEVKLFFTDNVLMVPSEY